MNTDTTEAEVELELPPRPDMSSIDLEPAEQLPAVQVHQSAEDAPPPRQEQRARFEEPLGEHELQGMISPALLAHMQRIALLMANSSLIPESLWSRAEGKGQARKLVPLSAKTVLANCFLVVNQARLWRIDPWALAQATSVVHGRLMFEGKVITAVLESTRQIRLKFEWNDQPGDAFGITVTERKAVEDGDELRAIQGTVGAWKTKGYQGVVSAAWQPPANRMQLAYRGAREWCRLHEPAVVLGVMMDDDADRLLERARADAAAISVATADELKTAVVTPGFRAKTKPTPKRRGPKFNMNDASAQTGAEPKPPADASEDGDGATDKADDATAANPVEKIDTAADPAGEPVDLHGKEEAQRYISSHLPAALAWDDIRLALATLRQSEWWKKEATSAEQRYLYARAWIRVRELLQSSRGRLAVSMIEDLTAFRCYLEHQTSSQALEATWEGVQGGDVYKALASKDKLGMATVVQNRLRELKYQEDQP